MQRFLGERGERPGRTFGSPAAKCTWPVRTGRALALFGLLGLGVSTPAAVAQVSSDGDIRPVILRGWDHLTDEPKTDTSKAAAAAAVWHVEAKSQILATLLVTGDAAGGLGPDTEHHFLPASLGSALAHAVASGMPLFLRRTTGDGPFALGDLPGDTVHRRVARRFTITERRTRLRTRISDGSFVFHLQSRARTKDNARIDHYLHVDVSDPAAPRIDWYLDAQSKVVRFDEFSEDVDRRWAVEPAAQTGGRLTPVAEAVGYHLRPLERGGESKPSTGLQR